MLALFGRTERLGKYWTAYFLIRNPSIKALKGMRLKKSRAKVVTPNKIKEFFAILNKLLIK